MRKRGQEKKKKKPKVSNLKKLTMVLCLLTESQEQDEKRTLIIQWTERRTGAVMGAGSL